MTDVNICFSFQYCTRIKHYRGKFYFSFDDLGPLISQDHRVDGYARIIFKKKCLNYRTDRLVKYNIIHGYTCTEGLAQYYFQKSGECVLSSDS